MSLHPYVARVDGKAVVRTVLSRREASQWDVAFLVKSGSMLTSNVLYRLSRDQGLIYLQRVTEMEFDMLEAFDVPCISGSRFMKDSMGISSSYLNDNDTEVFFSSRDINDANVAERDYSHSRLLRMPKSK